MHQMPTIWLMYLETLTAQKLITRTHETFDRAFSALHVTQHGRIWEAYLVFVSQEGVSLETKLSVYRRCLEYDPVTHAEDFVEIPLKYGRWKEAAENLATVLSDILHICIVLTLHSCMFWSFRLGILHFSFFFPLHKSLSGVGVSIGVLEEHRSGQWERPTTPAPDETKAARPLAAGSAPAPNQHPVDISRKWERPRRSEVRTPRAKTKKRNWHSERRPAAG
ncbi:hypothetical protein F2Q70_00001726 [Brassica cretica]|uniref:Pre-mRNA-splicing factor Syf1-like N-terminal HAT-repeats domain-containing protein n=1 Tax=Brassica cretica TaxID=69181 RepID=A0A8S9J1B2_BRACR|nr:hypothetical protein F2Q70_00001726 [Brassica cretica]